uniref:Seven cysteines N-terminal domain-containing protein n=1 Tax=Anabas testudineus TaxID=64144 RepID=A0A3Q1J1D6_ANATE
TLLVSRSSCYSEITISRLCSPTSYYKNCWIRRFPGVFIDIEESLRRGARLVFILVYVSYDTRVCVCVCVCFPPTVSCNLAIFHYDTTQDNVNCFHLHCPTLESCILSHRGNVVLYNITKGKETQTIGSSTASVHVPGVDPDLLVFGKYFTSNVRVLPHHYSRVNASELLPSDKRQFIHPPPPAILPLTSAPTVKTPITVSRVPTTTAITTTTTATTATTATITTTTPLQGTTQSTLFTTAASSSTSTAPPSVTGASAEITTLTTSRVSTPSFTTPPSSTITTTLGHYSSHTTPAFSTTTAQPSPSTITHYYTTFSQSATSPPTSPESSKQYPNDPKDEGVSGEDTSGGFGPGWHVAAHSLLVAVAICVTVLLSCCCSILLVVSWRGQRKRMGRYRTSWRGKKGSMRLIKYVLVRESS